MEKIYVKIIDKSFFVSHIKNKIKPYTGLEWHEGDIIC